MILKRKVAQFLVSSGGPYSQLMSSAYKLKVKCSILDIKFSLAFWGIYISSLDAMYIWTRWSNKFVNVLHDGHPNFHRKLLNNRKKKPCPIQLQDPSLGTRGKKIFRIHTYIKHLHYNVCISNKKDLLNGCIIWIPHLEEKSAKKGKIMNVCTVMSQRLVAKEKWK